MIVDEEKIERMYLEEGKSVGQIAKEIGITPGIVNGRLKKRGVTLRTKKEAAEKYAKVDICAICGKTFRVREDWLHGNHYRKTCSPECEKEYRSKRIKETYTDERRQTMSKKLTGREVSWHVPCKEEAYNWKGGKAPKTFRKMAFDEYGLEKKCSVCGSLKNICVHHKDRNRSNNSIDNLMVVCKPCHTSLHCKEGDNGFANHSYNSIHNCVDVTPEQIRLDIESNKSVRRIAKERNICSNSIAKIMKANGIENPRKRKGKELK